MRTAYIEPGSPWGEAARKTIRGMVFRPNGYNERFNGALRDECLNRERFYTLKEAQHIIEAWRREYNHIRPHSALGYMPPAPLAHIAATRTVGDNLTAQHPISMMPTCAMDGLQSASY